MSRNQKTIMIGGALILIALFLVCGPLTGRFGGPASVGEPPSVAAGPPAGVGVLGAGAAGAIVGAGVGEGQLAAAGAGRGADGLEDETARCRRFENESDEEWRLRLEQIENEGGFDEDCARWAAGSGYAGLAGAAASGGLAATPVSAVSASNASNKAGAAVSDATRGASRAAAGVAGAGAGAGAAIAAGTASSGLGGGSGSSGSGAGIGAATTANLPLATIAGGSGGSGVVTTPVNGSRLAAAAAVSAANTFDTKLASVGAGPRSDGGLSGGGVGPGGPVVNRFAPPVAAPGGGGYNIASANPFGVGKGNALQPCDQPGSGCRNLRGIPANPPIIPGGRPTPPANPPIIPGGRPTPPSLN